MYSGVLTPYPSKEETEAEREQIGNEIRKIAELEKARRAVGTDDVRLCDATQIPLAQKVEVLKEHVRAQEERLKLYEVQFRELCEMLLGFAERVGVPLKQ